MLGFVKRWWAAFKRPSDPLFKRRPQAPELFGDWVLVELGATEYVILMDTLHTIHNNDSDIETKGREILGLRYQALAMSCRTKSGKQPLDWRSEVDLMWLARLPYSEVVPALKQIAKLSDLPWLSPDIDESSRMQESEQPSFARPTSEEIAANPL